MDDPGARPRFLADAMLGSLARWLRILGYDTAYDNRIEDLRMLLRCRREGRIALTRDRRLLQRRHLPPHLFIRAGDLPDQIREVLEYLDEKPPPEGLLSRCLECNRALRPVSPAEVHGSVPDFVHRTQTRFKQCPACTRIYWPGTHRRNIYERLKGCL